MIPVRGKGPGEALYVGDSRIRPGFRGKRVLGKNEGPGGRVWGINLVGRASIDDVDPKGFSKSKCPHHDSNECLTVDRLPA